jgi:hypothetical protein
VDDLVRIGRGPDLFDGADEVHVSVAFTWDIPLAEKLAREWAHVAPVKIGGPAYNGKGGDFIPGMYLKRGYVITSRGCPNNCWFCSVPKREGREIRELPITEGWNVLDDNLLACSSHHIESVFAMLRRQKEPVEFTGGLEAARIHKAWAYKLSILRIKQIFFAYDTPDDLEPLQQAGKYLQEAGFAVHPHSHALRAYVLVGYPKDTFEQAEMRLKQTMEAGFTPMAMLWKDETGKRDPVWAKFQREWARPAIIYANNGRRQCYGPHTELPDLPRLGVPTV